MSKLTSRNRLLNSIALKEVDHIPCCFMSFEALRKIHNDNRNESAKAEKQLGLDSMLFIPAASRSQRPEHPDLRGLPVRLHVDVKTKEWREKVEGDYDILHKEYLTPAGKLNTSVRLSNDWIHGNHIPFMDDYQVPRAIKPLITCSEDVEVLQFMLMNPLKQDKAAFEEEADKAHQFAETHDLLLSGGWGVGMDMLNWLCGMQDLMVHMIERPDFVTHLLEIVHIWNKERMKVILSSPIDLYMRRSFYEGCDFVTPQFYKEAILPRLKAEVDLAHEYNKKFAYMCTSGSAPILDYLLEAGVDVFIGVDPIQGTYTDMQLIKNKLRDKMCIWGGVSGAITVEMGTEFEIRSAVDKAIDILGPQGFILSPIDNITIDSPETWKNVDIFIDQWKKHIS